jgi:hypothetical protein
MSTFQNRKILLENEKELSNNSSETVPKFSEVKVERKKTVKSHC